MMDMATKLLALYGLNGSLWDFGHLYSGSGTGQERVLGLVL
jgi:hypothetical protein